MQRITGAVGVVMLSGRVMIQPTVKQSKFNQKCPRLPKITTTTTKTVSVRICFFCSNHFVLEISLQTIHFMAGLIRFINSILHSSVYLLSFNMKFAVWFG